MMGAKDFISYDPETGVFRWKVDRGGVKAGTVAGSVTNEGYVAIKFMGKSYKAHRMAWLFFHGGTIPQFIDHINGDKQDNRIRNLRLATSTQNQANSVAKKDKLKGAYYRKDGGYWRAMIQKNGVLVRLGNFSTEREAHEKYCDAARVLFGEFANPGYEVSK